MISTKFIEFINRLLIRNIMANSRTIKRETMKIRSSLDESKI